MLASWNALYWDDWITYAGGRQGTIDNFAECMRCTIPFRGEIEGLLIVPGPWLMRLLVFVFFPIIALLTQQFLRRTQWLHRDEETIIALGVLFLPMFGARIALIDFQYAFSLLLFTLGAWMALSPRRVTRLVALLPIFWSMFTPSFQVFVVVLLAVLVAQLVTKDKSLSGNRMILLGGLLSFPFIHRFLIPSLFPKYAFTDGYNTIRGAFLARALLIGALLLLPLVIVTRRWLAQRRADRATILLVVGLGLLAAGTFPYLAVGHFPNFSDWVLPFLPDQSDWNSRHQLLQPFGFAFIVASIVGPQGNPRLIRTVFFLSACLSVNLATYSQYYLDSLKQAEILRALSSNEAAFENTTAVAVRDYAVDFNARGRVVRPYEWAAMIQRSTGANIVSDADTREFCKEESPRLLVSVSPIGGRMESLLRRKALVNVEILEIDC